LVRQAVAETRSRVKRLPFVTEGGERLRETARTAERNTQMSGSPTLEQARAVNEDRFVVALQ
jgi:hypothetical protein